VVYIWVVREVVSVSWLLWTYTRNVILRSIDGVRTTHKRDSALALAMWGDRGVERLSMREKEAFNWVSKCADEYT